MYNLHNFFEVKIIKPKGEEITTRAYNLVTDFGKEQVMRGVAMSKYIDLGKGTTQPQPTDTALGSRLTTLTGTVSSSWNASRDTLTYTVVNVMDESVLPDTSFTEIGISNASGGGSLWTKALFTDSQGQSTSVYKGPLDRMEVRAVVYISIPATVTSNLNATMARNVLRRLSEGAQMQSLIKHSFVGMGKIGGKFIGFPGAHQEIWSGASYDTATRRAKVSTDWTSSLQGGWCNGATIVGTFSNGNLGNRAGVLYTDPFPEQDINTFPLGNGDGSNRDFPIFYTVSNKDSIKVKVGNVEKVKGTDYELEYLGALPLQGGHITEGGGSSKMDTQVFLPKEVGEANRSFIGGFMATANGTYVNSDYTAYPLNTMCVTLNADKSDIASTTDIISAGGTCRMGSGSSGNTVWGATQFGKYALFFGESRDKQWKLFEHVSDTVTNTYKIKGTVDRGDTMSAVYPIPRDYNDPKKGFVSILGELKWDATYDGFIWDGKQYQYDFYITSASTVIDTAAFEKDGTVKSLIRRGSALLQGTLTNNFTEQATLYKNNKIVGGTADADIVWFDLDTKNYLRWNVNNHRIEVGHCEEKGSDIVNIGDPVTIGPLPSGARDQAYRAILNRATPTSFVISASAPSDSYNNRPFEYVIEVPDSTKTWELATIASQSKLHLGHNRTGSVLRIQPGLTRMMHPVLDTGSHILMSNGSVWIKGLYKVKFKEDKAPLADEAVTVDFKTDTFRKDENWRFTASGSVGFDA